MITIWSEESLTYIDCIHCFLDLWSKIELVVYFINVQHYKMNIDIRNWLPRFASYTNSHAPHIVSFHSVSASGICGSVGRGLGSTCSINAIVQTILEHT